MVGDKRLAVVTGGGRGIGRASALRLAREGWAVAVGYGGNAGAAADTVAAIRAAGGTAEAFGADMGDADAIAALFAAAEAALGPLGVLVANAGITGTNARMEAQTAPDLRRLLEVNVLGPMLCAGAAIRRMSTRHGGSGGAIVLVSSVAARLGGLPGIVPYAATKGAIETLVRGLSNEVAGEGIRVVGVAPGLTRTDMTSDIDVDAVARTGAPMGRPGEPDEIAAAIAWAASPDAGYVTGTTLTVSGGR
jgi:NAD(P)-dependent dehydrogenase (short-subunit alcohol dehydrogenase family)